MHYLITGGAGFIGSHLSDALVNAGHKVTVVDDLSTGHRANLSKAVELVVGDCGDETLIQRLVARADGIFHLAAVASVEKSRQQWRQTHLINQTATVALLEAITRRKGSVIPFVYASSAAIYGDPPPSYLPLKESTPTKPLTPYGVDKYSCELHASVARHLYKIPTLGLRFFNVYGPRQDPVSPYSGVISIFCRKIADGTPITIFGDGKQTRDFIYISDVVDTLQSAMRILEAGKRPEAVAVNICAGRATGLLELAELIATISGRAVEKTHMPARTGDIRDSRGDPLLAQYLLKTQPRVSLKQGLALTLEWMGKTK